MLIRILVVACLMGLFALVPATTFAQNGSPVAGRVVYTTSQVPGQLSCSAGACHTSDPNSNQNRILKGADDPGAIGLAINSVSQMAFLKGKLSSTQFLDLAAYIGNPGGATGSPIAQLSPTSLGFASTVVGSSAVAQQFVINNTGTAPLVVENVVSSNADFSVLSSCGSIVAGASCTVSVGFTPTVTDTRTAVITVTHNATGGASTLAVSGFATAPVVLTPMIHVTPPALAFGSITVGLDSDMQPVTVTNVGTAPLTLNAIMVIGNDFSIIVGGGSCAVNVPIAVGMSCTVSVWFMPVAEGALNATLMINHNANAVAASVSLSGTGVARTTQNTKTMVEYVYVPLNYFFVTSRDADKAILDAISGFRRTGLSFPVFATQTGNAKSLSRFYFDQIARGGSRGSHFYTLLDADKAALRALNPNNAQTPGMPFDEGVDSWAFLPVVAGVGGSCATGQTPVYRVFRGGARFPDDPNHRFTTDVSTYNTSVALGWDGEGVSFCVP